MDAEKKLEYIAAKVEQAYERFDVIEQVISSMPDRDEAFRLRMALSCVTRSLNRISACTILSDFDPAVEEA